MVQVQKVLIIGGGLTGGYVANFLKNMPKIDLEIQVWECNSYIGGRMATIFPNPMIQSFKNIGIDIGAQYITKFNKNNDDVYEYLKKEGVLREFTKFEFIDGLKEKSKEYPHYLSSSGAMMAIPEHYLHGVNVQLNRAVKSIEAVKHQGLKVSYIDKEKDANDTIGDQMNYSYFDIVILAIPPKQLSKINTPLFASKHCRSVPIPKLLQNASFSSR